MKEKPKLLIVEDDDLTQDIYKKIFSKDFTLVACKNDEEFYTVLKMNLYQIFLIDLSLGSGVDGIQLMKDLRNMNEYASTPIMVVTAHAFNKDERNSKEAGATMFFRKPIDNKTLLREFKKILSLE